MARRYVPKTYNNRSFLRLIAGAVIAIALSIVTIFLVLYFLFKSYAVEGKLEIPWLTNETASPSFQVTDEDYHEDIDSDE